MQRPFCCGPTLSPQFHFLPVLSHHEPYRKPLCPLSALRTYKHPASRPLHWLVSAQTSLPTLQTLPHQEASCCQGGLTSHPEPVFPSPTGWDTSLPLPPFIYILPSQEPANPPGTSVYQLPRRKQ